MCIDRFVDKTDMNGVTSNTFGMNVNNTYRNESESSESSHNTQEEYLQHVNTLCVQLIKLRDHNFISNHFWTGSYKIISNLIAIMTIF